MSGLNFLLFLLFFVFPILFVGVMILLEERKGKQQKEDIHEPYNYQ